MCTPTRYGRNNVNYLGAYCEVHDKPDPSNEIVSCKHEVVALSETINLQGTQKFFYPKTGNVLNRRNFIEYPIPDIVIKKVNKWGEKMSRERYRSNLEFINCTKETFLWDCEYFMYGLFENELANHDTIDLPA